MVAVVSVSDFDIFEIMDEITPILTKKLISNAMSVPIKAARTTLENFIMLCV
jgi:hypothetical protein